jgi:hypothetical protein
VSRFSLLPLFGVFLTSSAFLHADSHPSWWTYASPEATALVGIQWDSLRHSIFADGIASELAPGGDLRFPDLACLRDSRQIVVSSPALLAMVTGNFPMTRVREQAERIGFKPVNYKGVPVWYPADKETLGVAFMSDNLLLLGSRRTLESALDRSASEAPKHYSPLLARASRFAQNADLWVVASQLPDPLASLFLPIDVDARGFEGLISMRSGMYVSAVIDAESDKRAVELANRLRGSTASLPGVFQSIKVEPEKSNVTISLEVNREQLAASLYGSKTPAPVAARPTPAVQPAVVAAVREAVPSPPATTVAKAEPKPESSTPVAAAPAPVPEGPQVVRILGLDDGPREIVLPPVKKQQ